ncbi:MFS transporter [Rubrivirga sp. S365]|uniref:MFS transporter n=1 Tax=Rubrivirga litoralis TaxID=3075598 RepID=A0ABU3BQI9_9BACT|nr:MULTISPECIES: MFS transporter [unclassified Rubrivirga]MDT0631559.1 MFS transporter [Rubrivirga sp. F394]MDT7857194.1 MFS transporter [Rubrivirga sp. S365]
MTPDASPAPLAEDDRQPGATLALALATLALAVNFWAWNLLGPLAPTYRELLSLTPFQVSLLVAVPALIGSLARIPIGALTDRLGGRVMFTAVTALTILPVVFLSVADAYSSLLVGGLFLGLGGASFAVGIPFVNAWTPPARRGLALGIYGAGNVGTAVSGFLSPSIAESMGRPAAFWVVAVALAATAAVFFLLGRDAPGRTPSAGSMTARFVEAFKLPVARDLAFLYAVTFGGFVAFGAYLPTFLVDAYGLEVADAALRAAGFIVLATVTRPIGGALSDRFGGVPVLLVSLITIGLGAVVTAFEPGIVTATVGFLAIAAALGAGNGAVFALVGRRSPPSQVGSITGLVGAAGGLGGFLPPIIMGLVFQATGSYAIGLMLLSDVAFAGAIYAAWRLREVRLSDAS